MANRWFSEFQQTLEKGVVELWTIFKVGAAGAPTLQQWDPNALSYKAAGALGWHGIKSIVRNSTGNYTVTLTDTYQKRVIEFNPTFEISTTAAAVSGNIQSHALGTTGGGTITFVFVSAAGVAADPANGELVHAKFTLSNSSAL